MYQFLTKNGQAVAFVVGIVITLIFLAMVLMDPQTATIDTMEKPEKYAVGMFNFGITMALILTVIAALAMLFFGIASVASNFSASVKGIIGLVGLIVLFVVAYLISSGEPETARLAYAIAKFESSQGTDISTGVYKFIGGSITTAVLLILLAVLSVIVTGVISFMRDR